MEDRSKQVHAAVARLLTSLGVDWEHAPNYKETPRRMAAWLLEKFPDQENREVLRAQMARKVFPSSYDGIVAQSGIKVFGLCPHHLLPVVYDVSLGYLPHGYVIGLSKLTRLAELELGVAGTQEDVTMQLADSMIIMLRTNDVAVVVSGVHQCMAVRGVKQSFSRTTTSEMRGGFRTGGLKEEFFRLVHNGNGVK